MEPRRFSGKTVDEATDIALEALDVNREDVEIVVVNPGRSGILGFGGEPAEIGVTLLDGAAPAGQGAPGYDAPFDDDEAPGEDADDDAREFDADDDESDETDLDDDEDQYAAPAPYAVADPDPDPPEAPAYSESREQQEPGGAPAEYARPDEPRREPDQPREPDPEVIDFASEVIDYFLASMNVVADTYVREETDDGVPVFDLEGEDSGLLIGRRGETLQSFQYLVNLIVTHQLGRSAYVQIDVEGYKERRRDTLTGVARRSASRVADTGEPFELEPMPAYERRWIHMALAESPDTRTESHGEGADRYVVIYPKDGAGNSAGNGGRRRGGRRRRRE